jgi:hypothetical protein
MKTLLMMPASVRRSYRLMQRALLREDVEPAFGSHFVPPFRHQHRHLRLDATGDGNHFLGRRQFQVELDLRQFAELLDVGVLNVSSIFAQVDGDPVGTAEMRFDRRPHRIGFVGAARLSDRRHMVDIDAQFDHSSCSSLKILRLARCLPPV